MMLFWMGKEEKENEIELRKSKLIYPSKFTIHLLDLVVGSSCSSTYQLPWGQVKTTRYTLPATAFLTR